MSRNSSFSKIRVVIPILSNSYAVKLEEGFFLNVKLVKGKIYLKDFSFNTTYLLLGTLEVEYIKDEAYEIAKEYFQKNNKEFKLDKKISTRDLYLVETDKPLRDYNWSSNREFFKEVSVSYLQAETRVYFLNKELREISEESSILFDLKKFKISYSFALKNLLNDKIEGDFGFSDFEILH